METVTGYVGHIVFRNEENGYTVFHLENDDGEVTCVGNFNFINEGEMLELPIIVKADVQDVRSVDVPEFLVEGPQFLPGLLKKLVHLLELRTLTQIRNQAAACKVDEAPFVGFVQNRIRLTEKRQYPLARGYGLGHPIIHGTTIAMVG